MLYTRKKKPKLDWGHLLLAASIGMLLLVICVWVLGGFSKPMPSETTTPTEAPTPTLVPTSTPAPSVQPSLTVPPITGKQEVTLSFTGDLLLDGNITHAGKDDFTPFFEKIAQTLQKADFTLGTLEAPCAQGEPSDYPSANAPKALLQALQKAGYDGVNLASFHALDQGAQGVTQSEEAFSSLKLPLTGTTKSQGTILEKGDLKLALLGYTAASNKEEESFDASVCALTQENVLRDVKKAEADGAQVIVAFVQWGDEKATTVTEEMEEKAKMLADASVDLVIGSHVRCVLPCALVKGLGADGQEKDCFVAYSLGAFLTNSLQAPRDASAVLNLTLSYDFDKSRLSFTNKTYVPTWTLRYSSNGQYHYEVLPVSLWQAQAYANIGSSQRKRIEKVYDETKSVLGEELVQPEP